MSEALQAALLALGVPGIAALIVGYIVRHMYLRIETLQDLRLADAKELQTTINAANMAMNTMATTMASNNQLIQTNNTAIQALTPLIQQLLIMKGGG